MFIEAPGHLPLGHIPPGHLSPETPPPPHYFESVTSREGGMCHILNRMHPVLSFKKIHIFILRITHIHSFLNIVVMET